MDKINKESSAINIIKKTFQGSFNKESFVYFIKNLLNHIEESSFVYKGNLIPDAYKSYIQSLERIGKYEDTKDDKLIDILVVHLKKNTSLERARTMQRNFIAWYLNGSRGGVLKEAALVAFVSPDSKDWRFSLVKMDYQIDNSKKTINVKQEFTPARRFSFLVGENESCHTAQSSLVPILINDKENPTLEQLEKAFDIEKVTKEFFGKYRDLFLELKESLEDIVSKDEKIKKDFKEKNVDIADFAKKLLGQIVFLYFLQKKGWFGVDRNSDWGTGPKNFLRLLFEKKIIDYSNFFNDILEPLFYEALRNDRSHDDHYFSYFKCKIPFLNGGLFDPLNDYDWSKTDVLLSDKIFSNKEKTKEGDVGNGILDIFDRYNFTVKEDEPLEKEVAVDPEMLGKVFENLLAVKDRKSKGTYYTPREIVHYMCQQSLINYLDIELKDKVKKEDIEILVKHGESAVEHDNAVEEKGKESKRYSYKLSKEIRGNAKLIDEKLSTIRVCDPAIGSGAFPVGMMAEIIRARNVLTSYIKDKKDRSIYNFKRHAIQECLYGVDIDSGAVEIAKLRLWLSLIVDEEDIKQIKPLPNLDYKIVCGNSLLKVEQNLFNLPLFKKLEELKPLFFDETNTQKKQEYREEIDALIKEITNGHKEFDFEVYFSEVFHEKKGFDIAIGNPPYVKEDVNREAFNGLRDTECYQGKMDLWYLFGCKGMDVLKSNGIMCFIATNNWVSNDGASKFRNKVVREGRIINFIDFGNYKVFMAGIQTMVYVLVKDSKPEKYSLTYGRLINNNADVGVISEFLNSKQEIESSDFIKYKVNLNRKDFIDNYIKFIPPVLNGILEKIKKSTSFRLQDNEIFSGIDVMQDFVNKSSANKLGNKFKVGDGVFVISDNEKNKNNWNKEELEIINPYYTTKEIKRYYTNKINNLWVLYTGLKTNHLISKYPNIKKHLDKFQKIITSVNKPYGLHRTRDKKIFLGEKILSIRKCSQPSFSYVDFPTYVSRTFLIIKSKRVNLKFLVGILNSKLIAFWLYQKGKLQGNMFQIDKMPIKSIPINATQVAKQKNITNRVEKIISITASPDYLENIAKQKKVKEYERQIDQLVYKLYDLTPEEIKIIEKSIL